MKMFVKPSEVNIINQWIIEMLFKHKFDDKFVWIELKWNSSENQIPFLLRQTFWKQIISNEFLAQTLKSSQNSQKSVSIQTQI